MSDKRTEFAAGGNPPVFHRLFILGNGFDLAHRYNTRYNYFRYWMEEKLKAVYPELEIDDKGHIVIDDNPEIPSVTVSHHGDETADENQTLYLLMWLLLNITTLDDEWNEFEAALHDLDLEGIIDMNGWTVEDNARDKEGFINPFHADADYSEMASDLQTAVRLLPKLFERWIEDVDIFAVPKLPIGDLMDEDSLYLSFNYTETLEKIYDVPGYLIDHIHGLRSGAAEYYSAESAFPNTVGKMIVGHGNDESREFDSSYINKERILQETIEELRKPVDSLLREHTALWGYIFQGGIREVYSFGFSFSDVDIPYIQQIVVSLKYGEDVTWYLNKYDDNPDDDGFVKNTKFEEVLRTCGFKGNFGRYD